MKKLYYFLTVSLLALFTIQATAQMTHIPDANFRQALVDLGYGVGMDGEYIPTANISGITSLIVEKKEIEDLTGIEDFEALTSLYCNKNKISNLDVSNNRVLRYLGCQSNKLLNLDISNNTALKYLNCSYNNITALYLTKNTALDQLYCDNNQLTALDISNNKEMNRLDCSNNQIKTLDVSKNIALEKLWCNTNQLSTLDVSKNKVLVELECFYNDLTSIDIRNDNNPIITRFYATYNPNLTCIYVDDKTADLSEWEIDDTANFVNNEDECGYTYIPNTVFLQTIIDLGYGAGAIDNYIPTANISGIESLNVSNKEITDLTGIEGFVALEILKCDGNQLTRLDVSKNTALTYLDCEQNKLSSLDVSNNTALTYLNCGDNQITNLDLSKNTVLVNISCYENQLLSIDMRNGNNKNVESFWAVTNPNLRCIYVDNKTDGRLYDWLVDENSIFVDDEAECAALTSINIINEPVFSVYPNPTNGILNFDFFGENVKGIRISDITGKIIFEQNNVSPSETLDISNLANGLYLVVVQTDKENISYKIIKE